MPPEDYLRLGFGLPQSELDLCDTSSSSLSSSEITSGSKLDICVPIGTMRQAYDAETDITLTWHPSMLFMVKEKLEWRQGFVL